VLMKTRSLENWAYGSVADGTVSVTSKQPTGARD
jgi:hypothetical protein